ncbi:hypothetical protein INR49_025499 [Caranx melampygus]|nr:hypothetical protein INR49_025499 [Caranx melampygus]
MGLPLSQSLWVGMLLLVVLLVVELPASLQRCIFDEVQAQVSEVTPRPPTGPEHLLTSGQDSSHPGWRRRRWSPLPDHSVLGEVAPPTPAPPQPIRIHTWVTRENDDLTDSEKPDVLAYAVHCQTDTSGRPVAGVVVMCRDRVTADTTNHQTTVQTVIHELFHALGFSKHLFHTWKDCSSSSQVGVKCFPRRKVVHSDGSGQMRIYTPSVISALQNHLVSTDPELGGPLENLDAAASRVSSHWESRVLRGSIMSAVLEDWTTVRIDPVTLAALQDTGWYTVNLSRTQSLSECWRKENTRQPAEDDHSGEMWGSDSRCFLSSLNRQTRLLAVNSSVEGRCYRHRCTGPNRYQVQVSGSEWVDCPAGGAIQIKGFQGLVFCPDRRLCLYPDITPPSHGVRTSPASNTSELYDTFTSVQDWTWSLITAVTALSSTAALCLLVVLIVSHRKRVSSMGQRSVEEPRHWDRFYMAELIHTSAIRDQ